MTDWAKFIEAKIKLAKKGASPSSVSPSPVSEEARIPKGQHRVTNFPVLDIGIHPKVSRQEWRLRLFGMVGKEVELDWEQLNAMPQIRDTSDFHCVTSWSQLDMAWEGVLARDVVALCEPLPEARFVSLHGYDNYTTNLPIETLLDDDVIIAHSVFGKPLTVEHGGPVRLVVPKRYGWKSAKWLKAIEFLDKDRPGFWEVRGYHNRADPWLEERFGWPVKGEG